MGGGSLLAGANEVEHGIDTITMMIPPPPLPHQNVSRHRWEEK